MPSVRQRQWKSQIQQQALLEFGSLRHACPEGVYLSLTPGNFALWSGVLFVRKGPYAPAVLRFQIAFPQSYPEAPPLVLFTSDVFHPLITPLTTYTYTTGSSSAADTVSATDEERLLPGGFSLRHGFPQWFERSQQLSTSPYVSQADRPDVQSQNEPADEIVSSEADLGVSAKLPLSIHMPPPKDDVGGSLSDLSPSIIEVLRYTKDVFENEALLDDLPIEAAGNPGAWHAWQAHRKRDKVSRNVSETPRPQNSTPQKSSDGSSRSKPSGEWNWKGVWVERVKRGVNTSLSEAMLFGGVDGDDLIHFLDLDDEAAESLRERFITTTASATGAGTSIPTEPKDQQELL